MLRRIQDGALDNPVISQPSLNSTDRVFGHYDISTLIQRFRLAHTSGERGIRKRGNLKAKYSGGRTRLSRIRITLCDTEISYSRDDPRTALIAFCASVSTSLKLSARRSLPGTSPKHKACFEIYQRVLNAYQPAFTNRSTLISRTPSDSAARALRLSTGSIRKVLHLVPDSNCGISNDRIAANAKYSKGID